MIWDPMFLRDIWSAQTSKTFELCLSLRPSVRLWSTRLRPNTKTYRLVNLHIFFYYLYADWYWKWAISVHRVRYLPYKSNRYTGVLTTWNIRFTPNLIFKINVITKNDLDWITGSGTSHINEVYEWGGY